MYVRYVEQIENSINLPDIVGVNTYDGVKMVKCEEIEDSDYHIAKYETDVDESTKFVVDIYKDDHECGGTLFEIRAKIVSIKGYECNILYNEMDIDPNDVVEYLGEAFAKIEKELSSSPKKEEDKPINIKVDLNKGDLSDVKKKLMEILDLL